MFNLKAGNREVIVTSARYSMKQERGALVIVGMEGNNSSVKGNAPKATTKDLAA